MVKMHVGEDLSNENCQQKMKDIFAAAFIQ
jgi:hypothetical protein